MHHDNIIALIPVSTPSCCFFAQNNLDLGTRNESICAVTGCVASGSFRVLVLWAPV